MNSLAQSPKVIITPSFLSFWSLWDLKKASSRNAHRQFQSPIGNCANTIINQIKIPINAAVLRMLGAPTLLLCLNPRTLVPAVPCGRAGRLAVLPSLSHRSGVRPTHTQRSRGPLLEAAGRVGMGMAPGVSLHQSPTGWEGFGPSTSVSPAWQETRGNC